MRWIICPKFFIFLFAFYCDFFLSIHFRLHKKFIYSIDIIWFLPVHHIISAVRKRLILRSEVVLSLVALHPTPNIAHTSKDPFSASDLRCVSSYTSFRFQIFAYIFCRRQKWWGFSSNLSTKCEGIPEVHQFSLE